MVITRDNTGITHKHPVGLREHFQITAKIECRVGVVCDVECFVGVLLRLELCACGQPGNYIQSHEVVQRISTRRQLHAFMQVSSDALAAALAPELMHLSEQPEIVRKRAVTASVREALSVHITSGGNIDYAEDDRDILTILGFRPEPLHAPALKAPWEAGRRGEESIAR